MELQWDLVHWKKSAKITEKISKTLGVDFEKVDFKIIIF